MKKVRVTRSNLSKEIRISPLYYNPEVRFASFLYGGFITAIVVNLPERKLAKRTSAVFNLL